MKKFILSAAAVAALVPVPTALSAEDIVLKCSGEAKIAVLAGSNFQAGLEDYAYHKSGLHVPADEFKRMDGVQRNTIQRELKIVISDEEISIAEDNGRNYTIEKNIRYGPFCDRCDDIRVSGAFSIDGTEIEGGKTVRLGFEPEYGARPAHHIFLYIDRLDGTFLLSTKQHLPAGEYSKAQGLQGTGERFEQEVQGTCERARRAI